MTAALALLAYAVAAGTLGARLLAGARWVVQAPRSGIIAWQALSTSVILAVLLAAVTSALPFLPLRFLLADALGAHTVTIVEHYNTPLGIWPGIVGLAVAGTCAALLLFTSGRCLRSVARARRAQREGLRLVGRPHPEGFTVVEDHRPVVYCLPGGPGTVVFTSGALDMLTARERLLVLGHENRHLRARHDVALAHSGALARTFRRIQFFEQAHQHIAILVEMSADDAASSGADRRSLARALVTLGSGTRPEAALGATGTAAVQRVRRLTTPPPRVRRGRGTLVGVVAVALLSLPVSIALAPALEAAARDCCRLLTLDDVPVAHATDGQALARQPSRP
ncbi:Zn-dependent protease with chaperone function [Nocardioides salarius]|uniref:Zn-dependent protease with chaperone function n=1 Tax=Nocardioides salarius TaxID=374513 RepID=A0ABS2MEA7_9ACTN|nr:M56 family metallopeptidase [Nocardioides salarius]MBM7509528.1 Zn-dependent protease with chaperone function [Nocardioides salarius]